VSWVSFGFPEPVRNQVLNTWFSDQVPIEFFAACGFSNTSLCSLIQFHNNLGGRRDRTQVNRADGSRHSSHFLWCAFALHPASRSAVYQGSCLCPYRG
jgi:hypothetical protein